MVLDDFKKLVADYMNRDSVLFDSNRVGQVDKLLLAANNAKAYAQRRLSFELARTTVDVVVNKDTGGALSSAVLHSDGATPVLIQTLERAFLPTSNNASLVPVDLINRDAQIRSTKRRVENVHDPRGTQLPATNTFAQVVRFGERVFIQNWDSKLFPNQNVTAAFDVVRWMPVYGANVAGACTSVASQQLTDTGQTFLTKGVTIGAVARNVTNGLSAIVNGLLSEITILLNGHIFTSPGHAYIVDIGVQEDFFLINCVDWMLYRTIQELNLFLKEDQRVSISATMMNDAWESVKAWNARLEKHGDDLDLE